MAQTKQIRSTARSVRVAGIATAALAVGGLSGSGFAMSVASATTTHAAKNIVISTTKNKKLGTLLVSGNTIYTLKANKTSCGTKCLQTWPPVLLPKGVTKATAGSGVSAAKLGTVARAGGVLQVTYAGKALYWFSGDKAAGQVKGNVTDTWGKWSDVVTVKPATSMSPGSGSGGNTGTGGVAF